MALAMDGVGVSDRLDEGSFTRYGFTWGPMEVERTATLSDDSRVLTIKTEHERLEVRVTPKGHKIEVLDED